MRLQDGTDISNGRVEVCQDGIWGSVCSSGWDHVDASVVCRQLGYNTEGNISVISNAYYHYLLLTKTWRLQAFLDLEAPCY